MRKAVAGIVLGGEGTTSQKDAADVNLEWDIVKTTAAYAQSCRRNCPRGQG
jgi:hypothetical protein